ncbi:RHS repeat domain-containing protein [Kribbella albertanoniae]|nr:RHS repeat-associated core domain-containing protein [Kribbella albertanoniae]
MPARRLKALIAVPTALAMLLGLHGQAAEAATTSTAKDKPWSPPKEKSVTGTDAAVKPRRPDPTDRSVLTGTPAVAWPKAGTAQVRLPDPWSSTLAGTGDNPTAQADELPVRIGRPEGKADPAPAEVKVELLGRRADRLLLKVDRTDGVANAGRLTMVVDYRGFQHTYGGDWNSRLRVVQLSGCDTCAGTPVKTSNDGSGELSAEVSTGSLYAVEAAPGGPAGDFKSSQLSPAATWQVGGSSGDFNWRYPMEVPPGLGGPAVDLSVDYSSGSVDGRTSATNNQPSWVGEGFELEPGGSIERKYASCYAKSEQSGTNDDRKIGDLCWATDNATITLNGKGGELIRDDATGVWRSRGDDGTTIERLTGASNGDNNGEYWVVTSDDGTKYYFGLNRPTGWASGKQETQSTWTVPVFGNHKNEPCYDSSFSSAHCQQAYKWNLDYVVDRHGNTMSLFYDVETNYYGRNASSSSVSKYTRAGNIARIEYGQRDGAVYSTPAVGRVQFTTAERCSPGSTCKVSDPAGYPDTPLDQSCTSSSKCENKFTPTFWTQKRLAKVTTEVWRGTAFASVDSWTFRHTFPAPGDGTRAGLWLDGIVNTGHVGGTVPTPEVGFDGIQLPNRVAGIDGIPAMNWFRVNAVHFGTGGELAVAYSPTECSAPGNVPAPDTNGKRCHPAKWTPDGQAERQDWFNKFVVTQVTESDRVSGLDPVVTKVDYLTPPAWRHDEEDGLVEIGKKTWAQWRGYERVRVTKGSTTGPQAITEHRYFRGMDGDKLASGGQKDVHITDSTGVRVEDLDPLAGTVRESITYDGTNVVERSVTDHWVSAPTATRVRSWGTTRAYKVEDTAIRQDEAVAGGGLRRNSSRNTYDADGRVTESVDFNNVAEPDDDTCTRYSYTANPAVGLKELPIREQTVKVACDKPWTAADVLQDDRITYDNGAATPTKGDITKVEELTGFDPAGAPVYKTSWEAAYDSFGRTTSTTDALRRTTTKAYLPASGGPVTKTVVTHPNGHQVTEDIDPAWGEETAVTGPDGRRTEIAYDPLGRTSKVWEPGRNRTETPNFSYEYQLRGDGPGVVKSTTLQADNSLETTIELTDGLLRPRQVQEPAPGGGRTVTDYVYDSRGELVKENGPYYNSAPPSDQVLVPREAELPLQKVTNYDGAIRPTSQVIKSRNTEKWRTTYSETADVHTTTPPQGEKPSTRITDAQGRLIELRQYSADTATGSYDSTKYTYTPAGQLASVTDPVGNAWTFDYDLRGRKIKESDPDKGVSTYTYDDEDQLLTSTDARGVTLAYSYDEVGRKTAVHERSTAGPKRAEWRYDSLGAGLPTSAIRYVDGQAYTTGITGYDSGGRPEGIEVTLPAREGALAGTYRVRNTYNPDGEVASTELPGVGGLPAETLQFGYNSHDLPTTLTGATSYVTGTSYTPYGEVESVTMSQTRGKWVQQLREYEAGTRRLTRVITERETAPERVADVNYSYDPAGNIRKISDVPSAASGEATDTQCFDYDHLRRLTAAWTPASNDCTTAPDASALGGPAPYWQSWTFDKVGNRQTETRHSAGGANTSTYTYPSVGQAQPHAVRKVSNGTTENTYAYDEMGNLTQRKLGGVEETFTWDAEGNLEEVTKNGKTTAFVYDADGNRMLRRDPSGTTFYLGQTELLLEPNGTLTGTRHYAHGKQTVAVRVGDKLTWLGNDHHGTPDLAIDADTQSVQRRRSTPYGESRGTPPAGWPGQKGFVGGVNDPSTGLVHLQAREYDPTIGKFISVDPVAEYEDAQQLNGYAYANNSPVTYADPDGQLAFIPIIILAIRLIPIIIRVVRAVPTIVRTMVPVVRTIVSSARHVVAGISRVVQTVRKVTTLVPRMKTVIKRIASNVRKTKTVTTRQTKYGRGPGTAKKPTSAAKKVAAAVKRNVANARKAAEKRSRQRAIDKGRKEEAKKARAKAKEEERKERDKKTLPQRYIESRQPARKTRGPDPKDYQETIDVANPPNGWTGTTATKGDPLPDPINDPTGHPHFVSPKDTHLMRPGPGASKAKWVAYYTWEILKPFLQRPPS